MANIIKYFLENASHYLTADQFEAFKKLDNAGKQQVAQALADGDDAKVRKLLGSNSEDIYDVAQRDTRDSSQFGRFDKNLKRKGA